MSTRLPAAGVTIGEGAVIERLRRSDLELDPYLVNSGFIYEDAKRAAMETICRQYLDIGRDYGLPLLLSTPTWRASRERIAAAGYAGVDVNGDNFGFLDALRKSYGGYSEKVVICGLPGMPTILVTRWLLTKRWSSMLGRRRSWQTPGSISF